MKTVKFRHQVKERCYLSDVEYPTQEHGTSWLIGKEVALIQLFLNLSIYPNNLVSLSVGLTSRVSESISLR